ncbi:membrane protein insertase YidC [Tahibacter amnicola]|uniref:Membrane protein insertase YidC n=1 Tax=Tahibacter amnicola TaxID=2976241 RepID=A0ABY6BFP7_9GAMM|nr:membrane protein insertase YidC [Tahibacter amnicola]UXI68431.1 membrane protein insertase YidC [Tahibacter amnicola]
MNNPRSFLLLALALVSFMIWNQWQQDFSQPPVAVTAAENTGVPAAATGTTPAPGTIPSADTPAPATASGSTAASVPAATAAAGDLIEVKSDVLKLAIDTRGGTIVRADLLAYPREPKDFANPVRLLDDNAATFFIAQTGLVSAQGSAAAPDHMATFTAEQKSYALADGQDSLEIPLTWQDAQSGLTVRKVFVIKRGSYVVDSRQEIANNGTAPWTGNAYRQLQRVSPPAAKSTFGITNPEAYSFTGAAWYSPSDKFKKLAFDKFAKSPLVDTTVTGGWIAMLQHHFVTAWIPPADEADVYSTSEITTATPPRYIVRAKSPLLTVAPGATQTTQARLFVGPKLPSAMTATAPGLHLAVDFGMLTFISEPLYWVLSKLHGLVNNWGFAIILLVLLIKIVFYKLSEAQYRSAAKMRKLQPRVQALKDRYGDDRQKMGQAMMELYQKEKINPLGGCLPMLVQIPVFFALYCVLLESVELRHAPFILWIQNLTAPDPYFVLPILNAAAMIATQHLTPTTGMDPVQARMMKAMPVVFSILFAFFPAGLVLYWTVNGIASLAQQWFVTRRVEASDKA